MPSLNKMLVLELARCEYVLARQNIIALGNFRHRQDPHHSRPGNGLLSKGLSTMPTCTVQAVPSSMSISLKISEPLTLSRLGERSVAVDASAKPQTTTTVTRHTTNHQESVTRCL
jgi:hypothetical protein